MQFTFFEKTDVGQVRKANEDHIGHLETEDGMVLVLCDGMGGHRGGATASRIAVDCIKEYFTTVDTDLPETSALTQAISFANEQIYATAVTDPDLKGMGTTCVVVLVKGDRLWIAHVGDSRAYLYADNRLHRLTRDHSFVQSLVDSGVITDEESESHPRKNELLSALGIRPEVKVEVTDQPILAQKSDRFLICSDGLNGMINGKEIASLMEHYLEPAMLCSKLIEAANQAGGTDNISVQVLRIDASPHAERSFVPILPPKQHQTTDPRPQTVTDIAAPPPKKAWMQPKLLIPAAALLLVLLVFAGFMLSRGPGKINAVDLLNSISDACKDKTADVLKECQGEKISWECSQAILASAKCAKSDTSDAAKAGAPEGDKVSDQPTDTTAQDSPKANP